VARVDRLAEDHRPIGFGAGPDTHLLLMARHPARDLGRLLIHVNIIFVGHSATYPVRLHGNVKASDTVVRCGMLVSLGLGSVSPTSREP
jgi:hypothetical protein